MTEDITDKFIRFSKILAFVLLPALIILFSFVTFERKTILKGVVLSSKQVTVRSPLKDTIVEKVLVKPGDTLEENQPAIQFVDTPGFSRQAEISGLSLERRVKDLVIFSNTYFGDLEKPSIRAQLEIQVGSVRQEELRFEDLKMKASLLTSSAPFKGDIARVFVNEYDKVDIGTPLYEIVQNESLYVKAMVPEKLFTLVAKGDKVYIKSSIYNYQWYKIFHGEVSFLSRFAQQDPLTGETVFEINIKINDAGDFFRVNTTVSCEVVRDRVGIIGYVFQSRNHTK
jgi:hypothetical protein